MRINRLVVQNFRAITSLELNGLGDMVVIAGPNGCGKSCIFDAIRLLKSVYGGYQPNEWQSWFGEFQINVNQQVSAFLDVFQAKDQPLSVTTEFSLSSVERVYLQAEAKDLLMRHTWKEVVPEAASWRSFGATPLASNLRIHQTEVEQKVGEKLSVLTEELQKDSHVGSVTIYPDGRIVTAPSLLLEMVFGNYDPQNIGIIDYHGANRNYNREQIGGVNLNIESNDDRMRQHALYNYANKYANLKTEMAGSYVRHLLAQKANPEAAADDSLSSTLKELFSTFFPGKEFLGPKPTSDGRLLFHVRTPNGSEHDIDDLSSGEKEVLYGYLRLRNAAPRNSVLLIDEPELHLNPRLMSGLGSFYHRHLGKSLNNQLWLVTHSDTLIREAVGQAGFSVFHMQPAGQSESANQVSAVAAEEQLERLVIGLVGDLAAYRPGAKIVVFEGDEETQFDVRMVNTLFPQFQMSVNAISGGSKARVAQLYGLLDEARKAGHIPGRFYSITDADSDSLASSAARQFSWDVYHIENYLLAPEFIYRVMGDLQLLTGSVNTVSGVETELRRCAEATIPSLIGHQLRTVVNKTLVSCIDFRFDPKRIDVAAAVYEAAQRTHTRIGAQIAGTVTRIALEELENSRREQARSELSSDEWKFKFRGRDVLKRFVGLYGGGISYDAFRDLIIAKMRDVEFRPEGMSKVLDRILDDRWDA